MADANGRVRDALEELAELTILEEGDPNSFRVRAYQNARRAVHALDRDVAEMSADELAGVRGIGRSIAGRIRELVDDGRIRRLEELRQRHPAGKRALLRVPGLGPKGVARLEEALGVVDVDGLVAAIEDGRLASLDGFGERSAVRLRAAVDRLGLDSKERRVPISDALPLAERLVAALREAPGVATAVHAGSLRRFAESVGDVDVLVAAEVPVDVLATIGHVVEVASVVGEGDAKTSVRTRDGLQIDVRRVPPASIGAAHVYFTGSKAHNIRLRQRAQMRGWSLNEYGLTDGGELRPFAREADLYAALDLVWIPPELREDDGEIEAAGDGTLGRFLSVEDLEGDLHDHTDLSGDGRVSLDRLVSAAVDRGLSYLAVTDHAEGLRINGAGVEEFRDQRERLRALEQRRGDIRLLHGAELNIDADGGLDFDDDFLATFDWLVASVHSHFDLPVAQQTARLVAAVEHPSVTAIGHLTGRMIGRRPGIDLDTDRLIDALVRTGTALEVNASLSRLDPPIDVLREAVDGGVEVVVSTDAHAVDELDRARFGVAHARRARTPPEKVLNTRTAEAFDGWLAGRR